MNLFTGLNKSVIVVPTETVTPSLATERNQPILEQWEAAKDDFMNLVENVSQFNITDIRTGMLSAMQETDDAFLATDENEELHEIPTGKIQKFEPATKCKNVSNYHNL